MKQQDVQCEVKIIKDGDCWRVWCEFRSVSFNQDTKLNISRSGQSETEDTEFKEIKFISSSISLVHQNVLDKFPNVNEITLDGSIYEPTIVNCRAIEKLTLNLKDFTGISKNTFTECGQLISVHLRNDGDIGQTFLIESLNSLQTVEELEIVKINFRQLSENFRSTLRSIVKLKRIFLNHDSITSVDNFVGLLNVEWIDLSNNKIEELPESAFSECPNLSKLNLARNPIRQLRFTEMLLTILTN